MSYFTMILVFFTLINFSSNLIQDKADIMHRTLVPPPSHLKYFTLGHADTVADTLWIRAIQDMGYCRFEGDVTEAISVSVEKSQSKDTIEVALNRKLPQSKCQDSWVYRMIDAVTDLAPKFKLAYATGATSLSIIVDDREGAGKLFEKGMRQFPDDWNLAYRAGYHFLFEMQQPSKAARYLKQAADNGAPSWVYSLVGKIYTNTGQAILAKTTLENFLKKNPEAKYSSRIEQRLIEANRALGLTTEKPNFKSIQEQAPGNPHKMDLMLPSYIDIENPNFE